MANKSIGIGALIVFIIVAVALAIWGGEALGFGKFVPVIDPGQEGFQFGKDLDIWFMLMLVAFLMIFIRKFEWGVCLAVLLSAATSFIVYLAVKQFYLHAVWNQSLMIGAVICSITVVIAIGVFLGTCKMWQYLFIGGAFAIFYCLIEWLVGSGLETLIGYKVCDTGGSILVHMCAAYFGIGVALGLRDKRAFDEPMYTTTHSVSFVWLASMLLWMLWPSFVTSLLPDEASITAGMITCYMAGIGSIISTYAVTMICQGKVNPLVYTYAMLCGPVAIGAPLLLVGPWAALLIGILAGIISALCFIYLQPVFCSKLGIMDVMGVHNLHGMGGWFGAICAMVILFIAGDANSAVGTIIMAVITCVLAIVAGAIIGYLCKLMHGAADEICTDKTDFIFNDDPSRS